MQKNMASKGGTAEKIWCVKGGSPKKWPLSLVVTASVIMQTTVPEGHKKRFYGSENSNFPGGECPRTPLLYYTPNGNSTSPTVSLQNTARGM